MELKQFEFDPYMLQETAPQTWVLYKHGDIEKVGSTPLRVLAALVEKKGQVVARPMLLQAGWPDHHGDKKSRDDVLNTAIRAIAKHLRGYSIKAKKGVGYIFTSDMQPARGSRGNRKTSLSGTGTARDGEARPEMMMPKIFRLLTDGKEHSLNVRALLRYMDSVLVGAGVFREDWRIRVRYDTSRLVSEGIIEEHLVWTYALRNPNDAPARHALKLMTALNLEGKPGFTSFHRIHDGKEEKILTSPTYKTREFAIRKKRITVTPQVPYPLKMIFEQEWSVSRDDPTIHNCFCPKECCVGTTQLEIIAKDANSVSVQLDNEQLKPVRETNGEYEFLIKGPILQGQAIELLLSFRSPKKKWKAAPSQQTVRNR